jgi:hypothetical protein
MNLTPYHSYRIDELRSQDRTAQFRLAHHPPVRPRVPKPVTVSVVVPHARPEVFAFLDVIGNHEAFTDHMLFDWSYSGPPSGLGARARVHSKAGSRIETIDIEVVDTNAPVRIVERNVSAGGRRVGTGTYELVERLPGTTQISFTYTWLRALVLDRAFAPLVRGILRRGIERAMERLAEQLTRSAAVSEVIGAIPDTTADTPPDLVAIEQTMLRHLLTPDLGDGQP